MDDNLIRLLKAFASLVSDFLPYAEGTVELCEHVRALNFDHLLPANHLTIITYLKVLKRLVSDSDTQSNSTRSEM